jgi:hypothetical protein
MNQLVRAFLAIVTLLTLGWGQARGGLITVTFDEPQLVDNDPLLTFYDGGMTFRGITGGPNLGITFSLNARERTKTSSLVGTFTPPGIMQLFSDTAREGEGISATMNVAGRFISSATFFYAAIDAVGEVSVFSGPNGTGTKLADVILPVTSPLTGPGTFVPADVPFAGVAGSIVFGGGNKQFAIDDLTLTVVPEPPAWSLLAFGALWCLAKCRRPRTVAAPVRRDCL